MRRALQPRAGVLPRHAVVAAPGTAGKRCADDVASGISVTSAGEQLAESAAYGSSPKTATKNTPSIGIDTVNETAREANGSCWNNACTDIRQDIATLYDRIRYSFTANDKKLARMIAAELQQRIPLWQELLEQKLAVNQAELARDPAAKVDCVAPELCLAQTETLQTNLALVDWSDSTDAILKKLEREVEAVKHLLPINC